MAKVKKQVVKKTKLTQPAQKPEDNGYGITSLVLGISSILLQVIGIVTGILAIIFANKQKKIQPNGMATAGLVTGIVGLVFQALTLLVIIFALAIFGAVLGSLAVTATPM